MRRFDAALVGVATILSGCAHFNTIYNADHLFQEAEQHRHAGRDSLARARYRDVVRKTADAYRARPNGEDADQTLFLLGRARLRLGESRAAKLALEEAARSTRDPGLRSRILVYAARARANMADPAGALASLTEAMEGGLQGPALAEAYLLRSSLLLERRDSEIGWSDLDRASDVDPGVRLEAGLERLRMSVERRNRERAEVAFARLLADGDAAQRLDTITALTTAAERLWGPLVAASLLAGADSSRWEQPARGRVRLARAELLRAAGDTAAASQEAWRVARGRGQSAAEARVRLATWRLGGTRDLGSASAVRPILLPAGDDAGVARLMDALDELDRYSNRGFEEPLGWFAAAEVARDQLAAPVLARGLFLAYADTDPADPWAPKALLAALAVSQAEDDRAWLRGRLEAHSDSPYVLAARGKAAPGFEALEEELQVRLREIRGR